MLSSWFGSVSSHRSQSRHARSHSRPALDDALPNAPSISRSTVGPANLTSDAPLDHAHIGNDPSVYAPTPSLIHSADKEAGTLRTSDATTSLDATTHQTTKRVATPERLERTLFTPQDAIVAQVFGKSVPPATDAHVSLLRPPNVPQLPFVSLMTSDSLPPPSTKATPSPNVRIGPRLTIYDPFSGVKLSAHTPVPSSTATPGDLSSATPIPTADDRKLWSSLERILELQAEIAAMHADMEGVGGKSIHVAPTAGSGVGEGGNSGPRKRSRRGQTLPVGDEEREEHESEAGATGGVSEISTDHSDGKDEDEDEDEDEDDIHGYGKRRRDEEFARLAEQFAQRKAAIDGIMNKLDDLSTALKTFHALPPPLFDLPVFPSRADTLSSTTSNISTASSLPPLHVHSGRPPSPFSSTPSQAASSVALPTVPPISTLAAVVPEDPSSPPGLGPLMVTPTRSRVASEIIPGAPHVESPSDMDPVHFAF